MASSLYAAAFVDCLDATQLALDLTSSLNKAALFTNALSVNTLTDSNFASAPYTSNEVSSAGYTAGGLLIPTPTLVGSSGPLKIVYDAGDLSWTGVSFTARYAVFYADGLAGNNVFFLLDFGADFTVVSNQFLIQFDPSGIWQWTL